MEKKHLEALYAFLLGPDGCDFQQDHTWVCDGTLTKTHLWMREHTVKGLLGFHACCDCEVVFNMPPLFRDEEEWCQ